MTTFFVDTSAVAKRYLQEVGSSWIRSWIKPSAGHVIIISDLTPVEMFSVLARKQRENAISNTDLVAAQNDFLSHVRREYLSIALDSAVLVNARHLTGHHSLRTLDAIQLACALRAAASLGTALTFVGSDIKLLAATVAEGFTTDNPLAHP